ncbi:hypothetical protein CC1G_09774 [Coprinopsis cinerea okayama7|uniref:F-box domain-containing protein n=1 Tax=Coprinopsis cinerea (strain Okayama-7 / 130 / ATCC MYA-4618 / FGSC 9003) TaxID=240176 RepID=A8PE43_COPC7|nr:hypothetical protein CC1G_09774 [Coprinopsis cinerea okayama7\|eukprot:XP_001840723.2 hypothetical protein CC1G_09774 [Coprinopsis cinerea okayama7\
MTSTQTSSLALDRPPQSFPVFSPGPATLYRPSSKRRSIPPDVWLSVIRSMFEAADFASLASFATTTKTNAALSQPFLFRDIVIRRTNNRNRKRADIEARKSTLLSLLNIRPLLVTYIRSISIYSSCRDTWWITNTSMMALTSHIFTRGTVTSITIAGYGPKGLDGRLLHSSILASLPPTIVSVTLSNIHFLSPRTFYALSTVTELRFTSVFCHAVGCRTVGRLLQANPPPPFGLRPSIQYLEYSRQTDAAETYYGSPCEVIGQYVQLGGLVEARFRTDHADDYDMLFPTLQQAARSLRTLTVDVTGVTINRYFRRYPCSAQFPALHELTDLVLVVTYSGDHPIREHPWQGLVFTLDSLATPRLSRLTVRIIYKGYWKVDFMYFLAALDDWQALDSALRARLKIFPNLVLALEFENFKRSDNMLWGQGEHAQASFIQQALLDARQVGPLQYGILTSSQIARMLPALFTLPNIQSRITFSWT